MEGFKKAIFRVIAIAAAVVSLLCAGAFWLWGFWDGLRASVVIVVLSPFVTYGVIGLIGFVHLIVTTFISVPVNKDGTLPQTTGDDT